MCVRYSVGLGLLVSLTRNLLLQMSREDLEADSPFLVRGLFDHEYPPLLQPKEVSSPFFCLFLIPLEVSHQASIKRSREAGCLSLNPTHLQEV